MSALTELSKQLDEAIKAESDPEILQKLSQQKALVIQAQEDEATLLEKHATLTESYKKAILTTAGTKNDKTSPDGTGYTPPKAVKEFGEFFKEKAKELEKKGT